MKRISVDIGGTFTDCFLTWDDLYVESKALTTHHNLSLGFMEALTQGCQEVGLGVSQVLSEVDSVRYATTLGTNALIEKKGPKIGLLVTSGYESMIPLSRGRGYGEGLPPEKQVDLPSAERPHPLVPIPLIAGVRERIDYKGEVLLSLDEEHLRFQIRSLVDQGAQAFVVAYVNSVINPEHEHRTEEVLLDEYPSHMLGAMPVILSHLVSGRKGEYVRATSAILDAFLHNEMYHGLSSLEMTLRDSSYRKPMLVVHNTGGMAQLNSTHALQTIHSGPVAGVNASEHLSNEFGLGNVICTDMGGTSFDIGLIVGGGIKFYDFNPIVDRWLVNLPMMHLETLGAGGGSIAHYSRLFNAIEVGPASAGSDPGPACYDRGGMQPTVTDADLILGYLDPDYYAGGKIKLNPRRAEFAIEENICDEMDISVIEAAQLIKQKVDTNMGHAIFQELGVRGFEPKQFTMLAYGGCGPLHCCGIANVLGIDKIFVPPFSPVFSAVGVANMDQLHIHEQSVFINIYDSNKNSLLNDYDHINHIIANLEGKGKDDLLRQGLKEQDIKFRLEFDMRYGNQLAQTSVVSPVSRINNVKDVMGIITAFSDDYGKRFGSGSQAPEAGIRINTIRVSAYVEMEKVRYFESKNNQEKVTPLGERMCYFVNDNKPVNTFVYRLETILSGAKIEGPALIESPRTTYVVEPGWTLELGQQGSAWLFHNR